MEEVGELAVDLIYVMKPIRDVEAILLFGSYANGTAGPGSDVDVLVVVKQGFEQTGRDHKGFAFEITFATEGETCAWWDGNPDHCVAFWKDAKVLFARGLVVERLRSVASAIERRGKPAVAPQEILKRKTAAQNYVRSLRARLESDPATITLVLYAKLLSWLGDYFDCRQLWRPPDKELMQTLRHLDADLAATLDRIASADCPLTERLQLLEEMLPVIFKPPR